jgi:ABC-type branched-subunit amino acid transport system ATPase component/ABC-type branched-subunit amino acid transport system permease subunit
MNALHAPVVVVAQACAVLPFALRAGALTLTSATDVVIFSIACMALNLLVGHTGLVSFGHGAWFGLGAYAAALAQRHWFAGSVVWPLLLALALLLALSALVGFLVLRRRGVYFSLLTLAFSALTYAIAFRWTAFTGGEYGLGGVTRAVWFGVDLANSWVYYTVVAGCGLAVVHALSRFHASPIGTVLLAIRENEQRAQFIGYATQRYKQFAYVVSATLTGFAGALFAFHHRFASADPTAVSFSGELLAMVIIGGMRSLLGPALGALFYILFREYLSIWTPNWLLYFGLLFVGFVVYSPTGLVGVWRRLTAPLRTPAVEAAAMAGRTVEPGIPRPEFLCRARHGEGAVLEARQLAKSFGGIHAVAAADLAVADRSLHALIGPNGAGKTTVFNLISGLHAPDRGRVLLDGRDLTGQAPHRIVAAGLARSFQITNLFPSLAVEENLRLAVQARDRHHFDGWTRATAIAAVTERTRELIRFLGLTGIARAEAGELSYGGQRLLDMGLALASAPRLLLLDEPLAGLAAAERERVSQLVKRISRDIHDRPAAEISRLGVSYVPQGRGLFAGMSVRDNLELGRLERHAGIGVAWSDDRILEFFPRLKARLDTPADFLSGGEQQMVAVARALSGDVRVLLLDEPFEGLAPAVVEELFEAFDRLRGEVAMVIVEHNLDLVLALADRAYVLERGSVVHEGAATALREDLDLRRRVLWM